jgi:phosphomannomutase/phosphoglucomutase
MNPFIFRREDIRGIVGQDFNYQDALLIGKAFGAFLRRHNCDSCFIGRDNRLSSEKISQNVAAGLCNAGLKVIDLGLCTTPMTYWTRYFYGFGVYGSLMVTGSHNPPEYNGMKPCFKDATTLENDDIQELRRLTESQDFVEGAGTLASQNILPDYFTDLVNSYNRVPIKTTRKLKVVVDSGNGVAGIFAPKFYRDLGFEVVELHSRLDGTFPNHLPDPAVGPNLSELVSAVRENRADLGIAFDGDVDRLNVVDETGYVVWADGITAFLARWLLAHEGGAAVLFNTQCSPALEEDIIAHGGRPVWVPTGHARMSDYIKRYTAKLAGEYKGHLYLSDYFYGIDDAIYAGARVMQLLSSLSEPLSKLLNNVPAYKATGEIFIPTTDDQKFLISKKVGEALKQKYFVTDYEGDLRIKFDASLPNTWGLVRHSDTMPKIEVYAWSKTEEDLTAARDIMVAEVNKYL